MNLLAPLNIFLGNSICLGSTLGAVTTAIFLTFPNASLPVSFTIKFKLLLGTFGNG